MGKGGLANADHASLPVYTWEEVGEHKARDDRWIVINGYVYDVTFWGKRHPGGEKIIGGHAGHDASVSMSDFYLEMHSIRVQRMLWKSCLSVTK